MACGAGLVFFFFFAFLLFIQLLIIHTDTFIKGEVTDPLHKRKQNCQLRNCYVLVGLNFVFADYLHVIFYIDDYNYLLIHYHWDYWEKMGISDVFSNLLNLWAKLLVELVAWYSSSNFCVLKEGILLFGGSLFFLVLLPSLASSSSLVAST